MRQLKTHIIFALLLSIFGSCTLHEENLFIKTADSLLWANPDSCLHYIEANEIEMEKNKRALLIFEHALYKVSSTYNHDSILSVLSQEFMDSHDYRSAGEAMYILGAHQVQTGNYFEATEALKEAEYFYQYAHNVSPILKGMLYFNLGVATERNRLFDIASEYYHLAIPFLKASQKPLYISAVYHNLCKSSSDRNASLEYLDSALYYTNNLDNLAYKKGIEVTRYLIQQPENASDKAHFICNLQYLCDTCQISSYAGVLAQTYLQEDRLIEATRYLEQLANDTLFNVWSKEQYYVLWADVLRKKGQKDQAYRLLKEIHERQTQEIESSAFTSTYLVSQKYDAAKEQELRLQEQVKKQRAYIWIVVVLLVCICIGGYTYYIYKNGKLKLQLSNEQKKRLEQELETDRAILRARISERIEIAKELYVWNSHHAEEMPDILGPLSPKQAVSDRQNWKNLYTEFNLCYNNVLAKLKEKHPALTEADLQYIVLTLLKYDITEMSFLLGIEKQTVWNRRTSVKRHLDMPDETNLNKWIANDMIKEYEIVEPQRILHSHRKKIRSTEKEKR